MRLAGLVPLAPHALVQELGEGLGEAVGEGLDDDGVVVVERALERRGELLAPMPAVTANAPDVVALPGRHEVREAAVRLVVAVLVLLAEHREPRAPSSRATTSSPSLGAGQNP